MNNCQLDYFPVELIHHLLSYFSAHEIFSTFINVTSYLDAVLISYSNYKINFKSITRTHFDLICQHIIPEQVSALTLSDDEDTPGLLELFLSNFQINQFTRLQSLKLIEIGPDFWENIITELVKLKNLRAFSFFPSNRNEPWIFNLPIEDHTPLDKRLFHTYAPILPQLHRLRLCHGDFFESTQFPQLRHLILERCSVDIMKHICSTASQLKSLEIDRFSGTPSLTELLSPLMHLNRLVLRIRDFRVTMNHIERMMSDLPRLKHLQLTATCNNDVVDGQRWQIKAKDLVTFKFMFNLSDRLESEKLDSFRTSFWLEEKRWFVAYTYKCLFSVPDFIATETDESFCLPIYSTVPDNTIFYEHIDTLQLGENYTNVNHHFTHVQTLSLGSPILPFDIAKIVNLNRVQRLILCFSLEDFPVMLLINEMPNLRRISIGHEAEDFLQQIRGQTVEKIQGLQINKFFRNVDDDDIEQLSVVFPNIKYLQVDLACSIIQIFAFLNRFKHLSTASFHYTAGSFDEEEDMQECRLKIQSDLDRVQCLQRLNYTYRFDRSSVHIWM